MPFADSTNNIIGAASVGYNEFVSMRAKVHALAPVDLIRARVPSACE